MKTSPNLALPYAEATDPRRQFPLDVDEPRTLALDAAVHALRVALGGRTIKAGSTIAAVSSAGGATVNLPAPAYAAAPIVLAALGDESGTFGYVQLVAASITASSFAVRVLNRAGDPVTGGNIRINWITLGQLP